MKLPPFLIEIQRVINDVRSRSLKVTVLAVIDKLSRWFTGEPLWRYTRISPTILLGAQPAANVLHKLAKAGVTGVINMRAEYDYAHEVGAANLHYLYLPTIDLTAPSLDDLKKGVAFIQDEIEGGGSVYIHCWEGMGRGPTMAAAYFVSTGCTPEQAWEKIREFRPFITPSHVQLEQLRKFAELPTAPTPPLPQPNVTVAAVKPVPPISDKPPEDAPVPAE